MNVAVKREVTGVLIYMKAGEAESFLKNPKQAQDEVAAMLKGTASMGGDDIDGMARLVIGDRAHLALPDPGKKTFRQYAKRGAKATPATRRARKSPRYSVAGRVNCPECSKPMKPGIGLASHRARMHGVPGSFKSAAQARSAAAQARKDFSADPS